MPKMGAEIDAHYLVLIGNGSIYSSKHISGYRQSLPLDIKAI
jgi:hypothetical protein